MKLTGTYSVPTAPPERVYALLQDPNVLAQCMPGCDGLEKTGEDEYQMKMKLLIASLSGAFEGKVRLKDQQPPSAFRMDVEGKGKVGFVKGEGAIALSPNGGGTDVAYEGDVQLGGTIAAVGSRLVDTTSKMMLKRFFDKLASIAAAPDSTSTSGPTSSVP